MAYTAGKGAMIRIGADSSELVAGLTAATNTVATAAQKIIDHWSGVTSGTNAATFAGAALVKQLQQEITTFGMTNNELLQHRANLNGVGAETQALIARLTGLKDAEATFKTSLESSNTALKEHGKEAKKAGEHVHEFSMQSSGAKRELLVLIHELSQGNYKKFGGSMLVLGEQTGAAGLLFSAAGLAIIGIGAAVIGVGGAMLHGAELQRQMGNALAMTGNYAGMTADSLNGLAHAAVVSGGSLGEAKKAVTTLAASGKFTGEQIGYISGAVIALEHVTGASIEETIKQFESLAVQSEGHSARSSTAISQATIKLDDQYHFLTLSVYGQIRALEREGDLKGASALATETFAEATKHRAHEMAANLGTVAKSWNAIKEAAGSALDAMGNWGKKATPGSNVEEIKAELQAFDARAATLSKLAGAPSGPGAEAERLKIVMQLTGAVVKLNQADAAANAIGAATMAQSEGVHAAQRVDAILLRAQNKEQTALTLALEEYRAENVKIAAGDKTDARVQPAFVAAAEAAITRAHKAAVKGNDDHSKLLDDALLLQKTAFDRETSLYGDRDKILDQYHSRFGMSDTDFYAGRETARKEYVDAEAASFAAEKILFDSFQGKNPVEIAANQTKYDALLRQHKEFSDKMKSARLADSVDELAAAKKSFDDIIKAIESTGIAEMKGLDDAIAKQKEHNAEIGKTKEQIDLIKQAAEDLDTIQMAIDANFIRSAMAKEGFDDKAMAAYRMRLTFLDDEVAKRRILAGLLGDAATLDAGKAARDIDLAATKKMWETVDKTAHDVFLDIFKSGKNAFDKLRDTLKSGLLDLLYQMTIKKWIFNIAASVKGSGAAGAAQGADSSGMGSAVSTANSLYKLYNGGVAGALSSVGGAVSSVGSFFGSASTAAYGTGMSMTTTAAATAAEAYTASAAAIAASDAALAGTYTAVAASLTEGAAVAATTTAAAGTVASALATIPVVGWIAAAAVLAYAAFGGKGKKETTATGVEGTFGSGTFTGNNFTDWKQKGGWFSSDSTGHDASALDAATAKQFSSGYAALQTGAANAADSLGLSAAAITNYSEKISLALTGDATKDAAAVTKLFSDVGNNMAAAVAPGIAALEKDGESASMALSRLSGSIITANAWLSMLRQRLFQVSMAGGDAASKLADAFGGLDSLTASSKAFYESYYTDGERVARSQADMTKALADVNLVLPDSKVAFKALAATLDLNTTAGRTAYATLLKLAPEFSDTTAALEKLAKDVADKLLTTFTGRGELVPSLNATELRVLAASDALAGSNGLTKGLTDAQKAALTFSDGVAGTAGLSKGLSAAEKAALGLTDGMTGTDGMSSGLTVAEKAALGLTDSMTGTDGLGKAAGAISTIFLDANSKILTFNPEAAKLSPLFTGAQTAAGLLNSEIFDLKGYAAGTTIDIGGLSKTLLGVNVAPVGVSIAGVNTALTGIDGLPVNTSVSDVNDYLQSIKVLPVGTSVADVNKYLEGVKALPVGTTIESVNTYLAGVKALPLGTAVADVNSYLTGVSSIPVGTSITDVNSYLAGVSALPVGTSVADANKYLSGILALPVGTSITGVNDYLAGISAVPVGTSIADANAYLAGVSAVPVGTSIADANAYLKGVSALPVGTSVADANKYLSGILALPVGTSITGVNDYLAGISAVPVGTSIADANAYLAGVSAVPVGTSIADANAYLKGISALPVGTSMASVNSYLAGVNALPVGTSVAAVNTALNGVDTTTFVTTIGLIFESLATRIKSVIGDISTERIAVRDAALHIINPTVMSRDAILRSIGAINTALPSNAGVVEAQRGVGVTDGWVKTQQDNLTVQRTLLGTYQDGLAATQKWQSDISGAYGTDTTYLARVKADLVDLSNNKNSSEKTRLMAADNAEITRVNSNLINLDTQYAQASNNIGIYTTQIAGQQAVVAAAVSTTNDRLTDQAWWVQYAKTQQLAYVAALQDFTIDASKSVGKLTKLREETVKYYDAQKALAELMSKSAAGLRDSVSAYRYSQLDPDKQFRDLETQYSTAYSMAMSTSGETLVGYSDKMSSLLGPLMDKMKEAGYTNDWDKAFINTMLAEAESVATRVETLTPTNYAADSLQMLGQIDGTLAALDASSASAEKIISDAINAGTVKNALGLHAVIAAITGQVIPAFASGGTHAGGWRIVGENGPEAEYTGPSQIFNAGQTRGMFSGGSGSTARLEALVERLTQKVESQSAELRAIAISNAKMSRLADRTYNEGTLVRTDSDTPLKTVAA